MALFPLLEDAALLILSEDVLLVGMVMPVTVGIKECLHKWCCWQSPWVIGIGGDSLLLVFLLLKTLWTLWPYGFVYQLEKFMM
ncbi:hypothetical protein HanIR_Chr12g0591311 [Helianthus annuus]|nr:hypothetical protein HanIR_Chr12g0591311 [Helianthus annuus]